MSIAVVCPRCGVKIQAPSRMAGRKAKCPKCGSPVQVGGGSAEPEAAAAPAAAKAHDRPQAAPLPVQHAIILCPHCGQSVALDDRFAGRLVACPHCNGAVQTPARPQQQLPLTSAAVYTPAPQQPGAAAVPSWEGLEDDDTPVRRRSRGGDGSGGSAAHSLGIGSMVLGVTGLLLSLIPCVGWVGLPLSAVGLLLGVSGAVVALLRGGRGIGFPVAGSAACALAALIGVFWLSVMTSFSKAVDDGAKAGNAAGATAESPDAPAAERPGNPAPRPPSSDAQRPAAGVWTDATNGTARLGDLTVSVEGVEVSTVDLKGPTGQGQSRDPCLQVHLSMKNLSKTKLIHVRGWGANEFLFAGRPELTDNFDNRYRGIDFGIFDHPAGQIVGGADVRPGEQEADTLVFDRPVDGVKYLRLTLPAENFGQEGSLRFQIPAGMIRR